MTAMNKCDERKENCDKKFAGLWKLILACFAFAACGYGYTYLTTSSLAASDKAHIQEHVSIAANVATKDDLDKMETRISDRLDKIAAKQETLVTNVKKTAAARRTYKEKIYCLDEKIKLLDRIEKRQAKMWVGGQAYQ